MPKQILFFIHKEKLIAHLNHSQPSGKKLFFSFDDDEEIRKELQAQGFEPAVRSQRQDGRDVFMKEYLGLMGRLSKQHGQSRLWWASDLVSKNRFVSRLSQLLQDFLEVVDVVRKEDCECLAILVPTWTILPSLKKVLQKEGVAFVVEDVRGACLQDLLVQRTRKIASLFYHAARLYGRAWYARWQLSSLIKKNILPQQQYCVVRSCVYNSSFGAKGAYKDAFFGPLIPFLEKEKKVIILVDIMGHYKTCVQKIKETVSPLAIPLEYFLSLADILRAILNILAYRPKLEKEIAFQGLNVSDILKNELLRTYNGITIYQYLNFESVRQLVQQTSVKTFILSYENNPWERMSIAAVRQFSPQTRIVSYQHNVVPLASANMFTSSLEKDIAPQPDYILTTGEIPRQIMLKYGAFAQDSIRTSCALRHEYLLNIKTDIPRPAGTMLVGLEGIFEVYHLINYVLKHLANDPAVKLIVRAHPVLPVEKIKHKIPYDLTKIKNLEISKENSLQKDIERAGVVIYWGSTVALEALWMGRPVIHFDNGSLLSYDPLFDCSALKWTVNRDSSLKATLAEIQKLEHNEFVRKKQAAKEYLHQYFYPINETNLSQFLTPGVAEKVL